MFPSRFVTNHPSDVRPAIERACAHENRAESPQVRQRRQETALARAGLDSASAAPGADLSVQDLCDLERDVDMVRRPPAETSTTVPRKNDWIRRFRLLGAVIVVAASPLFADDLHLKSGRVLSGEVLEKKDGKVVFMRPAGILTFSDGEIEKIVPTATELDSYLDRSKALADDDAAGQWKLAQWAKSVGLLAAYRREIDRCLAADPDHVEARAAAGFEKIDGQWLKGDDAKKARGLVKVDGQWMTREAADVLAAQRRETVRLAKLERELNGHIAGLFQSNEERARKAEADLLAFATREKITGLREAVTRLFPEARQWRDDARSVTAEIRLQKADVKAMREFSVPLGIGAPVKIQLPEVKRTAVSTTVTVPVR